MKCTTEWEKRYRQCGIAAHRIALLGLVILIVIGIRLENVEGLVAYPPQLRGKVRERCEVGQAVWVRVAGGMELAAKELDGGGSAQRSVDGVGIRDRM